MRTVQSRFAHDGVQGKRLATVAATTTTTTVESSAATTVKSSAAAMKPAANGTAVESSTTEPTPAKTTSSTAECSAAEAAATSKGGMHPTKTAMRPEYGMLSKGSVVHPKRLAISCSKTRSESPIRPTKRMLGEAAGTRGIQCDSSPSHG